MGLAAGSVAFGSALGACSSSSIGNEGAAEGQRGGKEEIAIVTAGGALTSAFKKHFFEPFTRETGVRVKSVEALTDVYAKARAMSESNNMEWDVATTGRPLDVINDDLFADVDCERLKNVEEQGVPGSCDDRGVSLYTIGVHVAYDTEEFSSDVPTTWADYWDTDRFPGPRGMLNVGEPWANLCIALLADGVPPDQLYPMDVDRAFAKMDEIKPHIEVWWETGDQSQQIQRNGEVVMQTMWTGRALTSREQGVPVDISMDQPIGGFTTWGLFKEAPAADGSYRFLDFFMTRPDAHVAFTEEINYPTYNKEALRRLARSRSRNAQKLGELEESIVQYYDPWILDRQDELIERWNSWLSA
jgi:spermidine/putrescine-binding protein